MIILYNKSKTDFTTNDLVLKNTIKCDVTWEKNGQFKINLIYPIVDGDDTYKSIVKGAIIKCAVAYQQDQLFRLQTPTKKFDHGYFYIEVTGLHITYDLSDNFLEDVRTINKSGKDAGQYILDNTQYKHPFIFDSDITDINTAYYIRQNPINALIGTDDNSFINRWGGEIVRDNFNIGIYKNGGENRGIVIKYSKNLTGLEQSADDSNLVTRAFPTAQLDNSTADGDGITPVLTLPEGYVNSPLINNYSHPYVKEVQVTFTDDQKNLPDNQKYQIMRDYVNNDLFSKQHVDVPVYSYTINFIDLSQTEEYKDYAILEEVHPYDLVTVKVLDIDVIAELVGYTFNALSKKYEDITLGDVQNDIVRSNNKSLFQISKDNAQNIKILQSQMESIPNIIQQDAPISGGNNLFDHSVLEDRYIDEWTATGASVVEDDTLHDTDKVWELPPSATINKNAIINNPNQYKGQQLVFSLQAKYNGANVISNGDYQQSQTNILLGALDMVVKKCIVDVYGTTWYINKDMSGVITDYIGVNEGTAFTVINTQTYSYTIHAYDLDKVLITDFTTGSIPIGAYYITVEITGADILPTSLIGFSIFETNNSTIIDISSIYADKTDSDWITHEQQFILSTEHQSDIIQSVNFRSTNNDTSATAYIGAFMINRGNTRNDYSQSSNDTIYTLRAHQVIADYVSAKQADIDQLHSTIASVDNLNVKVGNVIDLTAGTLKANTVNADNIVAGTITVGTDIIENGAITNALIADATITDAKINDVSANKLTAGTIDANVITVINLNASNITTGTLSASRISGGTFTLGGNNNGNGSEVIYNVSSQEVCKLDSNGLTLTLQKDPQGNLVSSFNVKDWEDNPILSINGGDSIASMDFHGTWFNIIDPLSADNVIITPQGWEQYDSASNKTSRYNATEFTYKGNNVWHEGNYGIVGMVASFAMNAIPNGWLKCNGQAVSRTTYSALFSAIGTTYGAGDGSTTFKLPDLRGEFVRGFDDGRGVDSQNTIGRWQGQTIQSHTHHYTVALLNHKGGGQNYIPYQNNSYNDGGLDTEATGSAETRPRNVSLLFCIKY